MQKIAPFYKAVAGALVAFLSALSAGLVDGGLSANEWITALIALVVAGGAVFTVPNIPNPESTDEEVVRRRT